MEFSLQLQKPVGSWQKDPEIGGTNWGKPAEDSSEVIN